MDKSESELPKSSEFEKIETVSKPTTKNTNNKFPISKPKKRNFKEMSATTTSEEIKRENSSYITTVQSRKKKLTNLNHSNNFNRNLTARKNLKSSNKISSSACGRDHNKERIPARSAKNLKSSRQGSNHNYKARTTVRNISTSQRKNYTSVDERKVENSEFLLTEINEEEDKPKPKKKV
jgi:hypothetical protein